MSITDWLDVLGSMARMTMLLAAPVLMCISTKHWFDGDHQRATLFAVWAVFMVSM